MPPIGSHPRVVVSVGNSRIKIGVADGAEVDDCQSFANDRIDDAAAAISALSAGAGRIPVALASVNNPVADELEKRVAGGTAEVYRLGRDIQLPLSLALSDRTTVGQDRLLNALGAFTRARQACVIIDAGTAMTVDFVDGEGTFQGGVIAPGLGMMLAALHEHTAALPKITFASPDPALGPFGKDTSHAMLLGVQCAARGLVRYVLEQYADAYGAYPQVVATGGDSRTLFETDPIVEHLVPDLQLVGLAAACEATLDIEQIEDKGDE